MTDPRFLQIHTLHSYPAALLNRDASGLAKRMTYGESSRTRISSQCLKRHWRTAQDDFAIHSIAGATQGVRSRNVIDRRVIDPLREVGGYNEEVLKAVEDAFNTELYSEGGTTERERQPLLFGLPEVEYLRQKAAAICDNFANNPEAAGEVAKGFAVTAEKIRNASGNTRAALRNAKQAAEAFFGDETQNFEAFRKSTALPGGLEAALFGRMVTSDPGANIEAAIHVAHAFTVHPEESESDYFSVVDDLQGKDEDPGAAHIGDTELTAGLFYGYVVVDVPGLVSNLEGCPAADWQRDDTNREMAAAVVHNLIQLIATVSPGAKLGSTAPYGYADLLLVEAGNRQPRSLANAYRQPAKARLEDAIPRLRDHLQKLDACYDGKEIRRVMVTEDCEIPRAERLSLGDLAAWAGGIVRSGQAE